MELTETESAMADVLLAVMNETPLIATTCTHVRISTEDGYAALMALVFCENEAMSEKMGRRIRTATCFESASVSLRKERVLFPDGGFPQREDEKPAFDHWSSAQRQTWQRLTEAVAAMGEADHPRRLPHCFDFRLADHETHSDVRVVMLAEHPDHAEWVAARLLNPDPVERGGERFAASPSITEDHAH